MDLDVDSFTRFCGLLPEAMLLVAADATVLAGNAAAAALCRRTEAQLRGMPLSELLLEPVEVIQSYLHQCIAGGHLYRGELTLRAGADHGHRYPIEGVPLLPRPGGLPATAVLLIRTSSEKTQAAQSPRSHAGEAPSTTSIGLGISARADASAGAERESLRVIMSTIADAVITTDSQGRITFMNPIAEGLTGWPQDQARGRPLPEVFQAVHQSTRRPVEDPVASVLRGDSGPAAPSSPSGQDAKAPAAAPQTLLISRQGFERPLEDTAVPIRGERGEVIGAVLVFRDASGRREQDRQAEALLAREKAVREQAQLANRIKDEFLATLSHELRTPLSAITGWVELLQHANLPAQQAARGLEVIKRNVKAQTQLINDLLDVSRILSGKLSIESKPVNMIAVVAAALDSVQLAASAKGVSLRTHLNADASQVQGDPTRLQQILWNVLHNAIKFTPTGGWVDVRLELDGKSVQITVTDNGVGIESEFLPHLFERFRQADSTTTRRHGGLGLGLALVRELTELHGGLVVADSPGIGKGTTITIWLPQRTAPLAGRSIQSSPSRISEPTLVRQNRLTGLITLLVEDDDDSREIVAMLLASYGAEVIEARSAAEAMQQLSRSVPDVLVSDIGLPDEDGFSLIRSVRALPPDKGGAVPALALTAFARNVDSERALQEGFQLHLAKPAAPQELIDTIARLVGRC